MRRLPSRVSILAAVLLAIAPARPHATPLPDLTLPAARLLPLPSAAAIAPAPVDTRLAACGTRFGAVADALAAHLARPAVALSPVTHATDAGGVAVLEDDGSFFYPLSDGRPVLDIAAVSNAFYRTHGDDYDFLAVYLATGLEQWLGSVNALAASWVLRNDTQGLGIPTYDLGPSFGSAARLQAVLTMNGLGKYPADPDASLGGFTNTFSTLGVLAHEFAHRWLAYPTLDSLGTESVALLGRDLQHWNFFFDADTSYMEGCEWAAAGPDSFRTLAVTSTFGALDQYLMGLRTRAELDSFFVVNDPTAFDPPGTYFPGGNPTPDVGCRGRATWWHLADIERVQGPRVPDGAVAPRHWRVAFALVTPPGTAATGADLAKVQAIRARFPQVIAAATGGRGSVDAGLDSRAGTVRLAHAPLADAETPGPRDVGVRAWIDPAGIPIALDPGSVTLHWRAGDAGPFAAAALAPVAPDSFAAALPALASGTWSYWFSAASDSAGIGATLPAAGGADPFRFTIGPDLVPPRVRHAAPRFQALDRMPAPLLARVDDNLGVDSVWFESSLDGGPVERVPVAGAGGDSFVVAAGAGLGYGRVLAYRFVARDRAAAGNLAYSNPAFDTLRVGRDSFDDFENPGGWTHRNILWLWRDAWAPDTATSSPAGGVSWHCGDPAGGAYPPHVDAALESPFLYYPEPGMTLTFDERHDLESAGGVWAYDAARVEVEAPQGTWQPVTPVPGYTHQVPYDGQPFARNSACWSGTSAGWVTRTVDLGAFTPTALRVRFRMFSDELVGRGGLWIDRVRVYWPGPWSLGVPAGAALAAGPAWPNPSTGPLALPLALPRAARIEWTLHDVQGRRVATLWDGAVPAGRNQLQAVAPVGLPAGLYLARVRADGRAIATARVALVR